MTNNRMLSYESLKCVLQHMEADKRLKAGHYCPSIRITDKAVPIKINKLVFKTGHIHVNDTMYRIGIYKKYHVGKTPKLVQKKNNEGGLIGEINKFGLPDTFDWKTLSHGDIDIVGLPEGRPVAYMPNAEERLDDQRLKLLSYQYQRDNAPVPFENFIQLTVESRRQKHIERYFHNKKFSEAMRQLATSLFGGRRSAIFVNLLDVASDNTVIRLPNNVKFQIRQLSLSGPISRDVANKLNALLPIIQNSSYPLDCLDVDILSMNDFAHPIVKESKKLIFSTMFGGPQRLPTLLNLTNQKVHISECGSSWSPEWLLSFVEQWTGTRRPIGAQFEFSFSEENILFKLWILVERRFKAVVSKERTSIISIVGDSQVEFSYSEGSDLYSKKRNWTFRLVVVA